MRPFIHFAIVVIMSTLTIAQSLPSPPAVTDPKQIASKPNAQVEKNLSIEKLYMTKGVGAAEWSPDAKQIVFVSNISGKPPWTGRAFSSLRMTSSSDGGSNPVSGAPACNGPRIGTRS